MAKIEDLIAQIPDERLKKAIVADHKTREKARKMGAPADLQALFDEL